MARPDADPAEAALQTLLERLDRLEELLEAMDDLGVSSRIEAERLMADLNTQVDALDDDAG